MASYPRLFHTRRCPSKHREIVCQSQSTVSNSFVSGGAKLVTLFLFDRGQHSVLCRESPSCYRCWTDRMWQDNSYVTFMLGLVHSLVLIPRNSTIPAREWVVCRGQGHSLYTTPSRRGYLCSNSHGLRDGFSRGRGGWLATGCKSVRCS